MNLLFKLIVASACRNTHHRLAMDALRQLRGANADLWRTLYLKHYESYLLGSKAPDEQFKDFKNHVLHVADNFWGGAPATAVMWYDRTVLALRNQFWPDAAYSAGVMSHYYSDPLMPFHTGQTEEEGKVHRAAEWSIACSYNELQNILEQDFGGYPVVAVPTGADWLKEMVRQGALYSHPHYDTIIEHYNLAKGVKDPPAGLDQEIKDRVAQCLGYAAVGIARILERAFAEAAVVPPAVDVSVETFLATLKVPIRYVTKKLQDDADRSLVHRIYDEVQRTGKCIQNLPPDDKLIRQLHAKQVLKMPLEQLDAVIPRATGRLHGIGTTARKRPTTAITQPAAARPKSATPPLKTFHEPATIVPAANGGTTIVRAGATSGPWKRIRWSNRPATVAPKPAAPMIRMTLPIAEPVQPAPPVASDRPDRSDRSVRSNEFPEPALRPAVDPVSEIPGAADDEPQTLGSVIEQKFSRLWSKVRTPKWIRKNAQPRDDASSVEANDNDGSAKPATDPPLTRRERRRREQEQQQREREQPRAPPSLPPQPLVSEAPEENEPAVEPARAAAVQPAPATRAAAAPSPPSSPAPPRDLRFYLDHDSPLEDAPSIGPKMAKRFETIGVQTVADFLALDPDSVASKLGVRAFDGETLRTWQAQTRLACRVPQIRGHDSQILVACGITDPDELAGMDPGSLFELLEPFLATPEAARILRNGNPPDLAEVTDWINAAKHARPLRAA